MRKALFLAAALAAAGAVLPADAAWAEDPIYTGRFSNTAVGGYDAVAYHTEGQAIRGEREFSTEWRGAEFRFASQANLRTFRRNPEQYIPAYGGFCALGVALGKKLDGDPRFSAVRDGQLYVFVNEEILRNFLNDEAGTLARAERNWTEIEHTAASDL